MSSRGRFLDLRREVLILLPVALLLLILLSLFTLFSYRSTLQVLVEERREEAARSARRLAEVLADPGTAGMPADLLRFEPRARSVAVVDRSGGLLAAAGEPVPVPLAPLQQRGERSPETALGLGPDDGLPAVVAGFAAWTGRDSAGTVRIDFPAEVLASRQRSLRLLFVLVLAIDGAVLALVMVFLRHLLAPWDMLMARARQVGRAGQGGEDGQAGEPAGDELEFLLATFERAIAALANGSQDAKTAEDDIAALERTLTASFESGLLLLDRQGRVIALNGVGSELLGITLNEPPVPLDQLLAGQPELLDRLGKAVEEGRSLNREECPVHAPRGELTVGLTLHPLRREEGAIRGYLVLFADLTETRRQAEETRLADSLSRVGEVAAGIAHELRNSLATLSGYLTLLERRAPPDAESREYLSEIRHETGHLQRVLDDFLAFARPGKVRVEEFALEPLLRRAIADPSLAGAPVRLEGRTETTLSGDPQLLDRALRNLLLNAVEAQRDSGDSGSVGLALRRVEGGGLEISVADRGPGVPAEIRERLFQPFATGRTGGVGLGLALAHRVVSLHGGSLRLEPRDGGGTVARLTLPAERVVASTAEAAEL